VIVPRPDRVRRMDGVSFGWFDARLVRDGWLGALPAPAVAVYAFLCVAADRQGVSFYRRDRIARAVGLDDVEAARALARLRELDLVAFEPFRPHTVDGFHQVLAVPAGGPPVSPLLAALGLRPR
jgi:hypothetical protein